MSEQCEFCLISFRNLKSHQENGKQCKKYRDIIFTCQKCGFSTPGKSIIDAHITNCDNKMKPVVNPIVEQEEKSEIFQKINNITTLLKLERFKNRLLTHIIEQNTSIHIDDIIVENEEDIHIYNTKDGNIPIFVHETFSGQEGLLIKQANTISHRKTISPIIQSKKKSVKEPEKETEEESETKHKKTYRAAKHNLDIIPELTNDEHIQHIKNIDEKQNQFENNINITDVRKEFVHIFEKLKQSRIYTKILEDLRNCRYQLFGKLSICEYKELINDHVHTIDKILREKKYTEKKKYSIISKGLFAIESRMIGYDNYTKIHLSVDEIDNFNRVLRSHCGTEKNYIIFDCLSTCKLFYNYGSVIFSVRQLITIFLFNRYGFNNVVYLPLSKNSIEDPYSFYYLTSKDKGKRWWTMDCRLEHISIDMISYLKPYMICTFKKIYKDVFGDNEFRPTYNKMCPITEYDCEQLLQNIILLSTPKRFSKLIRNLVKEKGYISPTDNDKFSMVSDDNHQRKRFQEKDDIDLADEIKQLFDGISSEDAVDFIRSRIT